MPPTPNWLGMSDDTPDRGLQLLQTHFDLVNDVMYGFDGFRWRKQAVVIDKDPLAVAPYPDIVDIADTLLAGDELSQQCRDFLSAAGGKLLAGKDPFRQGLNVAFDFH